MAKQRKDKHFIKKPSYPGGREALKAFIQENLKYPEEAQANDVEGTVTVRYSINHKGLVTEAHVIAGIGFGCDDEAVRLAKLLKFKVPKNARNLRVQFQKTIHVHFKKPQTKKKALNVSYHITQESDTSSSYHYSVAVGKTKSDN